MTRVAAERLIVLGTAGFLALAMLGAGGCGFFETRPLVPPDVSRTVPKADPIHPDSVLWNYQVAVRYSALGEAQLSDAMAEAFVMTLSERDSADLQFGSFGKQAKLKAYTDLSVANPDTAWFEFPDLGREPDFDGGTAVRYDTMRYVFQTLNPDDSVLRTYSGRATLQLNQDLSSNWVITRWGDFEDESGNQTWGRYLGEAVPPPSKPRSGVLDSSTADTHP